MDHLEKALKLALLCTKQTPTQRPTMYDVAQVLDSFLPVASPKYKASSQPSPGSKHRRYIDTYSAKQTEDIIASSSTSGGDLLDQFEDVISRNVWLNTLSQCHCLEHRAIEHCPHIMVFDSPSKSDHGFKSMGNFPEVLDHHGPYSQRVFEGLETLMEVTASTVVQCFTPHPALGTWSGT